MITTELLDKILLEWSYRCDKGYPDVNNPADWLVLENVLVEMGIELPFERILEENITTPVVKNSIKVDTIEEDDKTAKAARKASTELDKLIQSIPTMNISEKWGVLKSDERKDFENKVKSLLAGAGSDPLNRLRVFIERVNGLSKKSSSSSISDIFNRLVLMRTINNIITGFNPSAAGFIFEALTAAIMGGRQETGKTEAGVLANADVTVKGQSFSMKLISGSTKIKGSKKGLEDGVRQYKYVTYIVMLRSANDGKITFYSGIVDPTNLNKFKASNAGDKNDQFALTASVDVWQKTFKDWTVLGTLDVTNDTIRNVVQNSLVDLQEKVQPVYDALKEFTINLHTYFGTEKENARKEAASKAKQSAKELDSETQKVVR